MKRVFIIALLLILLGSAPIALASDISGARYYGIIQVSNNGTAATNVATTCNISTQNLIDGNYLNASANNCIIRTSAGADVLFMPAANATYPWCLWVPSIGADTYQNDILYTANSSGGKFRYFPDSEGMTSTDNASTEMGDNFTAEQRGWVDTSFTFTGDKDWITPISHNDPDGEWSNEINAYNNDTGNYATDTLPVGPNWGSYLEFSHGGLQVDRIRYYVGRETTGITQIDLDAYYSGTWHDVFEGAPTWNAYETQLLSANQTVTQARIRFYQNTAAADDAYIYDIDFYGDERAYINKERAIKIYNSGSGNITAQILQSSANVTATGVSSGEHTVTINATANTSNWATGDVLHFPRSSTSNINCGDIGDGAKLWVSLWFKLDSTYNSTSPSNWYVFDKFQNSNNRFTLFLVSGTGKLRYQHHSGGVVCFELNSTETEWLANQWYHVIVSLGQSTGGGAASDGARFRVDNDTAETSSNTTALSNTGDFILGDRIDGGGNGLEGFILNVIMGNDDLSEAEETALYNGTAPGDETEFWYVDEGSGANIISYGSVGTTGIADNGTDWQTSIYTSAATGRLCDFTIQVDSDRWGTNLKGASVPDNANDWTFLQNNVMPYMEYHRLWVNGVLQQDIVWEYATTFSDQSGNSHDAVPTFRTTSSDANVSANLTEFQPIAEAQAPDYVLGAAVPFIDSGITGNVTGTFTTTPGTGAFPLAGAITAVANATSTPPQLPLLIIAVVIILAASLTVSALMRQYGSGGLIAKVGVIVAFMGIFIALGNFAIDFWMLVVFLILSIALMFMSKQVAFQ